MKTAITTPPAAKSVLTPRTDAVNAMAQQIVSRKAFGSSTADTINEVVALYSKHAESLEIFNQNAVKRGDDLQCELGEANDLLDGADERMKDLYWRKQYGEACISWGRRYEEWQAELSTAVNAHAAAQQRIGELEKALSETTTQLQAQLDAESSADKQWTGLNMNNPQQALAHKILTAARIKSWDVLTAARLALRHHERT